MKQKGSSRTARSLLLAVTASIVVLLVGSAGARAAGPSYVSIGDSYTASGLAPLVPSAPEACAQSERNYPHLVAAALNLSLTDVSCGGATTSDETESQLEGQPPQDEALSESTEVVTVGMGGNDHGLFGTLVFGCTQYDFIEHLPGKAPCKEHLSVYVQATYAQDRAEEEAALNHIKELSPHAKVFLVGYLEITPSKGACPTQIPWYEGDLKWFHKAEAEGATLLREEAEATGAKFVNMFHYSQGHDACQSPEIRWVEPLFNPLTGIPLHPNATGEQQDAYDVKLAMLRAGIR
jgi:hypothetical protein